MPLKITLKVSLKSFISCIVRKALFKLNINTRSIVKNMTTKKKKFWTLVAVMCEP